MSDAFIDPENGQPHSFFNGEWYEVYVPEPGEDAEFEADMAAIRGEWRDD